MRFIIFVLIFSLAFAVSATAQELPRDGSEGEKQGETLADLKKQVARQEDTIKQLTKELGNALEALKKLQAGQENGEKSEATGTEPFAPVEQKSEEKLEGKINKVRMDKKLVLLDIGEDNGVRQNDIFDVYRASRKIGMVKVFVVVDGSMSNAGVVECEVDPIPGDKVVRVGHEEPVEPVAEPLPEPEEFAAGEEADSENKGDVLKRVEVLEGLLADLAKQVERLQARLENNRDASAEERVRQSTPVSEPARLNRPAELDAQIVQVTDKYVFLGVGKEQGIKNGDVFIIKRGIREVATAKVTSLIDDMCKAEIVTKNMDISKMTDKAFLQ